MFFKPKVTVTYNVRLKRARAQFSVAECQKSRRPPTEALDKAREKLEEELEDGHIEFYEVFEKRFSALWQHVREHSDSLAADKVIRFTLAQGARAYSEILVNRSRDPKILAELSCQITERKAKTIFFSSFVFHVIRQLQKLGIAEKPDSAQLRFLYLLMKAGQTLAAWPLKAAPQAKDYPNQKIMVELDRNHHFACLHIFDSRLLQDESKCERVFDKALQLLKQANEDAIPLQILKDHTLEKLRSLTNKVQALGFGMPYSLLIAFDSSYRLDAGVIQEEKQHAAADPSKELPRWKMRVGALLGKQKSEFIDIKVDASGMVATVAGLHEKNLKPLIGTLSSDWLLHECHKQGIEFGYEDFLEPIVEALKKEQNPVGMRIAEGLAAKPGRRPYLHECFRDPLLQKEGQEAVREKQNKRLARVGQLIAEIRYEDGIPGRNVHGEEIHALGSSMDAKITAGESVVLREGGRFYAVRDGLIEFDGHKIAVLKTYVHEGHVNLSSGNLAFDGSVVVLGDIEAGATVEVKGTLLVEGTIGNALVKVLGDLEVHAGIVTSQQGLVAVGGNCKAQFIENSRLQVKGNLEVATSLLNCEVVCGQRILVTDKGKGLISGGQISSWEAILVQQMGMAQGQTTICRIGTHYAAELRRNRLEHRLKAVQESREILLRALKEQATSAKAEAHREILQARLNKTDKLLKHLNQRRGQLEKQLTWNGKASLAIRGILDRNVEIHAAGKRIKITQNLREVLISATPYRGSNINDLSVWPEFLKTQAASNLEDAS